MERTTSSVMKVKDILELDHRKQRPASVQKERIIRTAKHFHTLDAKSKSRPSLKKGQLDHKFRARSRTPANHRAESKTIDSDRESQAFLDSKSSVHGRASQSLLQNKHTHTYDQTLASSHGGRSATKLTKQEPRSPTEKITAHSTHSLGGADTPGPGQYKFSSKFPGGPKFVIQSKTRRDSLLLSRIMQNVSPGPAMYSKQAKEVGGSKQTIGIKFK